MNNFVLTVAPALKAAFIHAGKVFAYIVLSAAIAAVASYLAGNTTIDPTYLIAANVALAAAKKAIDVLNS